MFSPTARQTWMALAILLNSLSQGLVVSYPNSLLPALRAPDSLIKVDLNIESWLASIPGTAMIFSIFIAPVSLKIFGRKISHLLMTLPGIIGWITIYFANNVTTLMIGRFLGGFSNMASFIVGCVVLGECACPENRGLFLNLKTTATTSGALFIHMISTFIYWRTVALICLAILTTSALMTFTWVESPAWLITKNDFNRSAESFYLLRGTGVKSVREFEAMVRAQVKRNLAHQPGSSVGIKIKEFFLKFTEKDFLKPTVILVFACLLLEGCGRHVFPVYAYDLVKNIFKDNSRFLIYVMVIDVVKVLSTCISSFLTKLLRIRVLLISSCILTIIVLVIMSLVFYLQESNIISNKEPWLIATLLILYFSAANLGGTSVPFILFGEIYPLHHREAGNLIGAIILSVFLFSSLKLAPYMFLYLHMYGTFSIFALAVLISTLYLYYTLPETKNRTLQEIGDYFKYGKFVDSDEVTETMLSSRGNKK